jgi:hypothetical protein
MGFFFGKKARQQRSLARAAARAADAARRARASGPVASEDGSDEEEVVDHWLSTSPVRETGIPRWRRQSLMAARKGIPAPGQTLVPLRFEGDLADEAEGLERLLVRYRLVRLLDIPDEVRGIEVDVLDEGDEVAILERRGMFCHVLCPDASEGWVHRMTLGAPPASPAPSDVGRPGQGSDATGEPAGVPDQLQPDSFEEIVRTVHEQRLGDTP